MTKAEFSPTGSHDIAEFEPAPTPVKKELMELIKRGISLNPLPYAIGMGREVFQQTGMSIPGRQNERLILRVNRPESGEGPQDLASVFHRIKHGDMTEVHHFAISRTPDGDLDISQRTFIDEPTTVEQKIKESQEEEFTDYDRIKNMERVFDTIGEHIAETEKAVAEERELGLGYVSKDEAEHLLADLRSAVAERETFGFGKDLLRPRSENFEPRPFSFLGLMGIRKPTPPPLNLMSPIESLPKLPPVTSQMRSEAAKMPDISVPLPKPLDLPLPPKLENPPLPPEKLDTPSVIHEKLPQPEFSFRQPPPTSL